MLIMSICFDCKRFVGEKKGNLACEAYPDGIPDNIFFDLEEEQECKKGYRFERSEAPE